jgi:alpha-glucosidase
VLRDAPARWEETRCLAGEPGSLVVFARRSGASWFIAGLNGTDAPRPVSLDLMAYGDYSQRLLIAEGVDAGMQVAVASVPSAPAWTHQLPPRGGFILRLNR